MRGKWLLIAGIAILGGAGLGSWSWWRSARETAKPKPEPAASAVYAGAEVSLPAKLQARSVVPVPAPVDGVLDLVLVEAGQEVAEGQLLVRIQSDALSAEEQRANLEMERARNRLANLEGALLAARLEASRAEAEAARARDEAARAEKVFLRQQLLYREGATPRLVFEKAEKERAAALEMQTTAVTLAGQAADRAAKIEGDIELARKAVSESEAALEEVKEEIAASEVHSPVDGLVVGIQAQTGAEVTRANQDLFLIAVDWSNLEAVAEPEPPVLARIQPGQPALITTAEFPGDGIPGAVREVKDGQVVVEFTSPDPAIRPGQTVQVKIRFDGGKPPAAP